MVGQQKQHWVTSSGHRKIEQETRKNMMGKSREQRVLVGFEEYLNEQTECKRVHPPVLV